MIDSKNENNLINIQSIHSHDLNEASVCKYIKVAEDASLKADNYQFSTLFGFYEKYINEFQLENNLVVVDSNNDVINNYHYKQLIEESSLLAKFLVYSNKNTSHTGKLIAVFSEKGYKQVLSALAIMKAGFGYLPLNLEWPSERINEILMQGQVKQVLVSQQQYSQLISQTSLAKQYEWLIIEDILNKLIKASNFKDIKLPIIKPNEIAYVIFTSGSTGKPKGVTISHNGALNTILAVNNKYKVTQYDSVLAVSELSFDLSVYDIFGLLAVGGAIIFPNQDKIHDPTYWLKLINDYKITIWNTVPQLVNLLVNELNNCSSYSINSLRLFLLSGDWIPLNLPNKIREYCHNANIVSLGGATEGSIWSIWYEINEINSKWISIPYGNAMPNQKIYVLNENVELCKVDMLGEIYIGGVGIALNYWQDQVKTKNSFIQHKVLGRLYKTGDLGKYHKDGYVEFHGRKDEQLKIRGYRVELGEIENKLMFFPSIKQAKVITHKHNDATYLIAYYVLEGLYNRQSEQEHLTICQSIYQETYNNLTTNANKNDFSGWNSSYTDLPIEINHMEEWLSNIINKIKQLDPKNVLEIGSGSGLIVYNLIHYCESYFATDFSEKSINYIKLTANISNLNEKINCFTCSADNIPFTNISAKIDTVIINSVIQHFPNIKYLETVINNLITNLPDLSHIIIGDIRDNRLLEVFHHSVLLYKNNLVTQEDLEFHKLRDRELLIDPKYFTSLGNLIKQIDYVEVLAKECILDNEMAKFRYEIIVYVKNNNLKPTQIINYTDFQVVDDIEAYLSARLTQDINLIKYPNANIYQDYINYSSLANFSDRLDLPNSPFNIEQIKYIAKKIGFDVRFYLDIYDYKYLNILFYKNIVGPVSFKISYDQNNYLVKDLYTAPNSKVTILNSVIEKDIEEYLAKLLPSYMLPHRLINLDKFPLNSNGKLDLKKLPRPNFNYSNNYISPRTSLESQVCEIFAEVLGLRKEEVGITHDFFKLGGDSIVNIQLVSRLRYKLGLHLNTNDIFTCRNIENLFDKILSKQIVNTDFKLNNILNETGVLKGYVNLFPAQELFFDKVRKGHYREPGHWNQTFLIKIDGILNQEILKLSLIKLIEFHDALRLGYAKTKNGSYKQVYREQMDFHNLNFFYLDKNHLERLTEYDNILTSWQANFKLFEKSYLFSVGYIEGYKDGSSRIFFALHQLIVDSISRRVLVHDLNELYNKFNQARSNHALEQLFLQSSEDLLGNKGTSYRQWVDLLKNDSLNHMNEGIYWYKLIADLNKYHEELANFIDDDLSYKCTSFDIDKEYTKLLLTKCNLTYTTEINDLLLASFGIALTKLTNLKNHYIMLEGHGRENIFKNVDISHTVGCFTAMYPLQLNINLFDDLNKTIVNVKDRLREIPNKGIYYGNLFGYINTELPKISFNYLGQFGKKVSNDITNNNWYIINEPSGNNVSKLNIESDIINATGIVNGDKLSFTISGKLSQAKLDFLGKEFKKSLLEIIKYTVNQDRNFLTLSDINNIISQESLTNLQNEKEISAIYLANSLQQGFLFHALNHGIEDSAYRVQTIFEYSNELNPELLRLSWATALLKYPALRIRFAWQEELIQIIDRQQELCWYYFDIETNNKTRQQQVLQQIIDNDRKKSYDLQEGSLLRVYLIKHGNTKYSCLISCHHAILDGWSNTVLFGFVHDLYLKLLKVQGNSKEQEKILNNINEDQAYLLSQKYLQNKANKNLNYWWNELANIDEYPDLSGLLKLSKKAVNLSEYRLILDRANLEINLEGNLFEQIKDFSQKAGVTLNVILQYVWHRLLSIYGNSHTTIVGTTVSGRNIPVEGVNESVGLYINTLPFIVHHLSEDGNKVNILDRLKLIQNRINELNLYNNISLADLRKSGRQLFDSLFLYENFPIWNTSLDNIVQINNLHEIEELDYPLGVIAGERYETLKIKINYAGELFEESTIANLLNGFKLILTQITKGHLKYQEEIRYLDDFTYKKVIYDWNKTDVSYPNNKTVHELFEEQAVKTPNNIAVIFENVQLTYQELDQKANQLAHYLKDKYQVKNDDLIGLLLDRSEYPPLAILSVLKTGGAYVPIDASYPDSRISYILKDTNSKVILTHGIYQERLSNIIVKENLLTAVETIDNNTLFKGTKTNLNSNVGVNNLAYVIYTSGTTGNPKGVMVEHKGIVNLKHAFTAKYQFDSYKQHEVLLQFAEYVFDASVEQFLLALLNGYTLLMVPKNLWLNSDKFYEYLNKNKVTHIDATPSFLEQYDFTKILSLKRIITGGENLTISCYKKLLLATNNIYNNYGPTEVSVSSVSEKVSDENILIGRPIANMTAYILDNNFNPSPIGAIGELYIGGVGVARGYLNLPELTRERFIKNPFQGEDEKLQNKNGGLYKTGDLVRYQSDGRIEYIGRNDFQIKIRGYRIELSEIENKLLSYPDIKQVFVTIYDNDGHKSLISYYVSDTKLSEEKILEYLNNNLPEYMVPRTLVWLEKIPLNINGKLDRKALPIPLLTDLKNYVAPRNELEKQLCIAYAKVLNLEFDQVGINDNFFKLGGNSINSIKLINKLKHDYEIELQMAELFVGKTIAKITQIIQNNFKKNYLIKLNSVNNKKKMFMVHPGFGGCEVYTELANSLSSNYECYGIDNFNLYSSNKILSLNSLAKYYLNLINTKFNFSNLNSEIILLGWSLGGVISVEIASILESYGYKNIKVYLLDSLIYNQEFHTLIKSFDYELIQKKRLSLLKEKYPNDYVQRILDNYDLEMKIVSDKISNKLCFTKLILFKAMLDNPELKTNKAKSFHTYIQKNTFNNLNTVVNNIDLIQVVNVENAHHFNILEFIDLLKKYLLT